MTLNAVSNWLHPMSSGGQSQDSRVGALLSCATIFVSGYFFSTWFLDLYVGGDQQYYRAFWTAMTWARPDQWQDIQGRYLGSNDYLYSVIISFGANNGFDRVYYISFWNGILAAALAYILVSYRASLIFAILLLTNYYFLVLLSSAERVKFAYIFLALSLCFDRPRIKFTLAILAAFCHTQAIVQFAASVIYGLSARREEIFKNKKLASFVVFAAPILVAISGYYLLTFAGEVLLQKSEFYVNESEGIWETIQWGLILMVGMLVFSNRVPFFLSMLPLGALTFLFGNRINIATFALFLSLALLQRKTSNPFVLAVMGYMSYKSIDFVTRVIATGQGFL